MALKETWCCEHGYIGIVVLLHGKLLAGNRNSCQERGRVVLDAGAHFTDTGADQFDTKKTKVGVFVNPVRQRYYCNTAQA